MKGCSRVYKRRQVDLKEGLILAHIWWLVSFQTRRAAVLELFIVSKFLKRTINRIEEF